MPVLALLALGAWVVAGCAAGSAASGAPSVVEVPMFSDQPSGKPGVVPPAQDAIEVTGVVESGVENGCTILRTDTAVYELMGSSDPLIRPGARLTVVGRARTDIATTCQQGTPLQVLEVRAAE